MNEVPGGALTTLPRPGRRRPPSIAAVVVIGVVILLVAAVVAGLVSATGGSGSSRRAGVAVPRVRNFPVHASGNAYTPANLARFVPAIVAGTLPNGGVATPGAGVPAGVAGLGGLLRQPAHLGACIGVVSQGGPSLVPLGVDVGSFAGQPAAVFVLPVPGQPSVADVFVEGAGCAAGRDATLYYERVPRPARR